MNTILALTIWFICHWEISLISLQKMDSKLIEFQFERKRD